MIQVDVPAMAIWLEHLVCDYNGTLADGGANSASTNYWIDWQGMWISMW